MPNVQMGLTVPIEVYTWLDEKAKIEEKPKATVVRKILQEAMLKERAK